MLINILLYADYNYYQLQSMTGSQLILTNLSDKITKLSNIIPKYIYSIGEINYVVDRDNNIHYIFLLQLKIPHVHLNVGKSTFNNFKILGQSNHTFKAGGYNAIYRGILLKSLDDDNLYEHVTFDDPSITTSNSEILLDNQINSSGNLYMYTKNNAYIHFRGKPVVTAFRDIDGKNLTHNTYNISKDPDTIFKQKDMSMFKHGVCVCQPYKYEDSEPYLFLVDNNNKCYLSKSQTEEIFYTLTKDSWVIYDSNNNIIIVTYNHIITIDISGNILQITLPVDNIYFAADNVIKEIVWTKQLYNRLPTHYRNLIKTFMMCNYTTGHLKIPHCVLSIIFNQVITKN